MFIKLDYMDLKQILSLQQDRLSNRMIAKTLGVNRNTVNEYMALFKACDMPFD
jgi:IS30 family transposase